MGIDSLAKSLEHRQVADSDKGAQHNGDAVEGVLALSGETGHKVEGNVNRTGKNSTIQLHISPTHKGNDAHIEKDKT